MRTSALFDTKNFEFFRQGKGGINFVRTSFMDGPIQQYPTGLLPKIAEQTTRFRNKQKNFHSSTGKYFSEVEQAECSFALNVTEFELCFIKCCSARLGC